MPATAALAHLDRWDIPAIEARIHDLTEQFLRTWPRPTGPGLEDPEHLVPILDAQKAPGWYPGWRTENAYVKYGDELWEVHDIKTLFHRVFTRLAAFGGLVTRRWSEPATDLLRIRDLGAANPRV